MALPIFNNYNNGVLKKTISCQPVLTLFDSESICNNKFIGFNHFL